AHVGGDHRLFEAHTEIDQYLVQARRAARVLRVRPPVHQVIRARRPKGYSALAETTTRKPAARRKKSATVKLREVEQEQLPGLPYEPPRRTRILESPPLNQAEPSVGAPL